MAVESWTVGDLLQWATDTDEELDVQIRRSGSVRIVDLCGDVDAYTCSKLRGAILDLLKRGELRLVVGMADVEYIDSSGLGTLVAALISISEHNGDFAISGASPQVRKALAVTGLSKILPLFSSEADAIRSFESEEALPAAA